MSLISREKLVALIENGHEWMVEETVVQNCPRD